VVTRNEPYMLQIGHVTDLIP